MKKFKKFIVSFDDKLFEGVKMLPTILNFGFKVNYKIFNMISYHAFKKQLKLSHKFLVAKKIFIKNLLHTNCECAIHSFAF